MEEAFGIACYMCHLEIVKFIWTSTMSRGQEINIRINEDEFFISACRQRNLKIVQFLCEIVDNYDYVIDNDRIIPSFKK
jgi:hypothetical protein